MSSWRVILATMVIFGAGVITGGVLVRQTMLRPNLNPNRQLNTAKIQPFNPGNARVEFLRRAQRELNLTPDQRNMVDEILKRSQERSHKAMEAAAPKMREEVQRTREEFREVLTPEQRVEFDRLLKQQQRIREPRPPMRDREGNWQPMPPPLNQPHPPFPGQAPDTVPPEGSSRPPE